MVISKKTTAIVSIRSFLFEYHMSDSELLSLLIEEINKPISGFELSWGPNDILSLDQSELDRIAVLLSKYPYNAFHCGSTGDRAFGLDQRLMEKFYMVIDFFFKRGLVKSVTIHANDVGDYDIPSKVNSGMQCLIEVMGSYNHSHNTYSEIEYIIKMEKGWGITLDTAHVYEMSLRGEPDIKYYLETFSDKICHIHLSSHTNPYKAYNEFSEFETQHTLINLCSEFRTYIEPFLDRLKCYPITLEGSVPNKQIFWDAFYKDLSLLEPIIC